MRPTTTQAYKCICNAAVAAAVGLHIICAYHHAQISSTLGYQRLFQASLLNYTLIIRTIGYTLLSNV